MKEHFLLVLENGTQCKCKDVFPMFWVFAFSFFKNYTVKCLDREYSDS